MQLATDQATGRTTCRVCGGSYPYHYVNLVGVCADCSTGAHPVARFVRKPQPALFLPSVGLDANFFRRHPAPRPLDAWEKTCLQLDAMDRVENSLSPVERTILDLHFRKLLAYRAIAVEFEIHPVTVGVAVRRIVARFRAAKLPVPGRRF